MSGARIFFGPAGATLVGVEPDGTPVTASVEDGVGPMTEIADYVVSVEGEVTR
ncbi:hypothetical protein [Cellulomonas shaoxiangyii]|uniref:hypothetical protein n=1 Tax=Cellulomonas shaoxiangyii TaxID=2566013 RepID=UPI00140C75B8|nr:hypothetical protein [Cellulomonas shaoxiangyii]